MERPRPQPQEHRGFAHYLRRDARMYFRFGPIPEIPAPLSAQLEQNNPRKILARERTEIEEIDKSVHQSDASERPSLPQRNSIFKKIGKFGLAAVQEAFWLGATYPIRGSFWSKINNFYDHPETFFQRQKLKWALKQTLKNQLPKSKFGEFMEKPIPSLLGKNRLFVQVPLYGISLTVPIGPLLSLYTNINNVAYAATHGEIRKAIGYSVLSLLDIGPFALGAALLTGALPLSLASGATILAINIAATFAPTQTMLNEPFQSAYTEAVVGNILRIVGHEEDPTKKAAHNRALQEFIVNQAKKRKIDPQDLLTLLIDRLKSDKEVIVGKGENPGKINQQKEALRQADEQRERLKQEHYTGKLFGIGHALHFIGKRLRGIKPLAAKILAERTLSSLEKERDNLALVENILRSQLPNV